MSDTLLLNADGAPLSVTPLSTLTWQESIKLIWLDKINVLEWHDGWEVHSPNHVLTVPAVISVREYVPNSGSVNFTRNNVFIRDMYTCQYCLDPFKPSELTLDHVIPKSRGGKTGWDNIVSACKKCNHAKGNRSDIKPFKEPVKPNFYQLYGNKNFTISIRHQIWLKYLNWPEEFVRMVA